MAGVLGGHLVGMSTTLEAIAAREAGMEILGISLVTNLAAGIGTEPLNHAEVLEAGRSAAARMGDLLGQLVRASDEGCHEGPGDRCRGLHRPGPDRGPHRPRPRGRRFDRVPAPDGTGIPWHTGDCADADAVADLSPRSRSTASCTWPAIPTTVTPDSVTSHVVTTAALLDAMVEHGVRRFVYAGSNHAVGRTPRPAEGLVTVEHRPRPDTFYGVGKVAAEAVMSLYADRYGLDAVSCRIGSFHAEPQSVRQLSTWLSPHDCVRMFERADARPPATRCSTGSRRTPAPGGTSSRPRARLRASGRRGDVLVEDRGVTRRRRRVRVRRRPVRHRGVLQARARPLVDEDRQADADQHQGHRR